MGHDEAEEYEEGKDMPAQAEPTEFVQKHNHSLKNLTRHAKHAEHDHAEHEHAEHEHDEAEQDGEEAEDKPAHAEPTEFLQKHNHSLKNLTRHAEHAEHDHADHEHAEHEHD